MRRLFGGKFHRRHARQDNLYPRTLTGRGTEVDSTAEAVGHDAVDDMQAEPGASLIAPRGEKRIERPLSDVRAHAASIVGEHDLDVIVAGLLHLDLDGA